MEPGVQTCEETLAQARRLVPRHRLAAGADPAPPRPRGALRLRLPGAAHRRRESARRPVGADGGLHRPARLGRGVRARRRLDRPRSDLGAVRRRGPHPARLHARSVAAPRRSPAPPMPARSSSPSPTTCSASTRTRASPSRTPRSSGRRSTRSAHAVDADLDAARRAPDHGRRADLRVDRRHGRRGVEHRGAAARPSAASPASCCGGCRRASRPAACCTTARANGTRASRCRAGRWRASGARDGAAGVARPRAARRRDRDHAAAALAQAARFIERWRCASASPPELAVPGYEDVVLLPVEGRHAAGQRRSAASRPRRSERAPPPGRRCCSRGLGTVTGYALPLRWRAHRDDGERWQSSRWTFRRGRMYLVPGNSPMGYRLPLDSLPWVPPEQRERADGALAVRAARRRCGDLHGQVAQRYSELRGGGGVARRRTQRAGAPTPRTIERRSDGTCCTPRCASSRATAGCYVFLPPLTHLEHYLDLVAAIEATAARAGACRWCSKATSRRAIRACARLQITPDPGRDRGQHPPGAQLERAARASPRCSTRRRATARLGTEKFMLDGRHTGTGGGNHVTLGGATPADSPLLRRPDLLRSLVTYWQHHPCLSYLFSGLFVGPTSQAPRVDEARDDSLYELEIAFQQMPPGEVAAAVARRPPAPQPADRRHRQHAPRRVLHRQAVLAGQRRPAASAWSSCAPSRCRRTRA